MRFLFVLTTLSLALAGCNGGEDFSDATVPGCPAGAGCDPSSRGDVLVELAGPHVSNLGYTCTGTNVVFFTSDTDQESVDSDGNVVTVPAFNALCPDGAQGVEFFVGSGLFEGNKVSLGSYLLPQQLQKGKYQVTMADLVLPPTRSDANSSVLYRSALVQALDGDGDVTNAVSIPVKAPDNSGIDANEVIDDNPGLIPSQPFDGYANYSDFVNAWQDMVNTINSALQTEGEPDVVGFDTDTSNYAARLALGTDRTRAGLYTFESAGECLIFQGCDFGGADGSRLALAMRALVLPNGKLLAGGQLIRSKDSDTELDFVGLESAASLSETLQLENSGTSSDEVRLTGAGIGASPPGNTDANLKGRILGQTMYAGVEVNNTGDYSLDYPSASYALKDSDKGGLEGELLGEDVPADAESSAMPVRGTKTGAVEIELDEALLASAVGDYRITLMRACIGEADDGSPSVCDSIPNPEQEVGDDEGFNYPSSITRGTTTADITSERAREDENGITDFCLSIDGSGLITAGDNGSCGTTHQVGMVTRTFPDSSSLNVNLRLAPGMDVRSLAAHYNTEIQGRIDLDDACFPMYRLSDESFDEKVRAGWVEQFYLPAILREGWSDQESPSDEELLVFASSQSGAVVFGEDGCTP